LIQKVPKKSSQQKCFFAHMAFAAQTTKNLGLQSFYSTAFARGPRFSKKLLCPAHRTALPVFPGFFPKLFC